MHRICDLLSIHVLVRTAWHLDSIWDVLGAAFYDLMMFFLEMLHIFCLPQLICWVLFKKKTIGAEEVLLSFDIINFKPGYQDQIKERYIRFKNLRILLKYFLLGCYTSYILLYYRTEKLEFHTIFIKEINLVVIIFLWNQN